jgi:phosphatidate phosphatase APP1
MGPPAGRRHLAARLEDALDGALRAVVRRRGWTPRVTTSTGYGDPGAVRLFARVLFASPVERGARRNGRPVSPRGWRSLVTIPAVGVDVEVLVGGRVHVLTSDRGGYVHGEVLTELAPGWHDASLAVEGREPVVSRVRVVDGATVCGVVSDIDDTILVTWLPRPLHAAWNTFFLREHARRPVPGMAELLRQLVGADGLMIYLSTGAWNFAGHLERFIAEHGFPPGPLLLTDWGPTDAGWFRSGAAHKHAALERLRRDHPNTRWILVGDDGQRDPQVYAAFAAIHPDAVAAVAIRRLTRTQRALSSGDGARTHEPAVPTDPPVALPRWVTGADGYELASALETVVPCAQGRELP